MYFDRILHAFLNFLKYEDYLPDSVCLCVLLHISALLSHWTCFKKEDVVLSDLVKLSCKMDGIMIIYLGHSNLRIRKCCISILSSFYKIFDKYEIKESKPFLSLYSILLKDDFDIQNLAIKSFATKNLPQDSLSPRVLGALGHFTVMELICSDYGFLYQYFYGSLVTKFVFKGRLKALRHCCKFLLSMFVPILSKNLSNDLPEDVMTHRMRILLCLSVAGIPVTFF